MSSPVAVVAPAAVEDAIKAFPSERELFRVVPPNAGEWSSMFERGVRVYHKQRKVMGWICLASQVCRDKWEFLELYSMKTTNATAHLREWHAITAKKALLTAATKRTRDEEVQQLESSPLFVQDPARLHLLLETRRIVFNNLPFRVGEYVESQILNQLLVKDKFKATINAKTVTHSILEMYASAKREVVSKFRRSSIEEVPCFTMVTDFWSCTKQSSKYLGPRVYFIDDNWDFASVLLGTRLFNPSHAERTQGIRGPFRRWIVQMLGDFELSEADFFGAMSDAGSDVKWMMSKGLKLQWEWCVAHMVNAATKAAFGLEPRATTRNSELTELIDGIRRTIRTVRDVETMGSLFEALCELEGSCKSVQLVNFQSHRFLGLGRVLERLVEKGNPLVKCFDTRVRAPGQAPPAPFPLDGKLELLEQLLSLVSPINALNAMAQAEAPTQVRTLLTLFQLGMVTLNEKEPLRYARAKDGDVSYFLVPTLKAEVVRTRKLLAQALDTRLFHRYTDAGERITSSYVFEVQLFLTPEFKSLDLSLGRVISFCNARLGVSQGAIVRIVGQIKRKVHDKVRKAMIEIASSADHQHLTTLAASSTTTDGLDVFPDELLAFFSGSTGSVPRTSVSEDRVDEELTRWESSPVDRTQTSVLKFWKEQADGNNYKFLPQVAKVYFGLPSSSAQIERDFGQSGRMVTPHRSSLASHSIDMCSFLSANREYVDLSQCDKIDKKERGGSIPPHILIGMLGGGEAELVNEISEAFSSSSMDAGTM